MVKKIFAVCCILIGVLIFQGCSGCSEAKQEESAAVQESTPTPTAVPKKDPVYYYEFPNVLGMEAGEAVSQIKETGFENVVIKSENGGQIANSTDYIVKKQNQTEGEMVESKTEIVLTCGIKEYELYLEIDFHENWIFDKYDLELYLDGEFLDDLPHGQQYTRLLTEPVGSHTITLYKKDDHDISYTQEVDLQESSTFSCNVNSHGDGLEVTHVYFAPGVEYSRIEMPDVVGMSLPDAIKELESCEFVNINYESDDGWPIIIKENWTVTAQNVEAGLHYDKNEEIVLTVTRNW